MVAYQLVCRGSQLVQQWPASGRLDDVQKAPEVAAVLQPGWLQEIVNSLQKSTSHVAAKLAPGIVDRL